MSTATKSKKVRSDKLDKLIGPTDKAIDARARERIITARICLLFKQPFFGNLGTRLQLTNADDWLATAATDGLKLYYNSRFIMMLQPKEVEFLIAHEIGHVVYDHMGRRENRDPQIWNIAGDYAINADLKRHKVGQFITTVPCLYEPKYDGKAAEEIYDDLMANATKINMDSLIDQLLDDHMDEQDEGDGDGDGKDGPNGKSGKPTKGKRPTMTQEERDRARQEIKQAIINAAQSAEAGTLPAGMERLIKATTNPTMPWRELIQTNLTSSIRSDYSYMKPSRRSWHMDAILPGMIPGEEIDVWVAIDMSGSISMKMAQSFLSEVGGMMDAFDGFKVRVISFDTAVYNDQTFTSENMDTIDGYVPCGGGGTDFECVYDYIRQDGGSPKRLIMFTDGYPCGSWGDETLCDSTFIIHGSTTIEPPFGSWAYLNDLPK